VVVGAALGSLIVGPAPAFRQPCDPAKCGLDFSEPPTDEDIEIMASLTTSPIDRLLASQANNPFLSYEAARKARPLEPQMPAGLTRWDGDHDGDDGRYIYRSINTDDLEQLRGDGSLRPRGKSGTVRQHVQNSPTHFLSASETYKGAQELMHPYGIIVIDVEELRATGSRVKWNSDVLNDLRSQRATQTEIENSERTQEVLVINGIARSAIVGWLP
jgi:hypothetical protein